MKVMSAEQEQQLDRLLELANGDLDLLEDALANAASDKFEDIVEYLLLKELLKEKEVA